MLTKFTTRAVDGIHRSGTAAPCPSPPLVRQASGGRIRYAAHQAASRDRALPLGRRGQDAGSQRSRRGPGRFTMPWDAIQRYRLFEAERPRFPSSASRSWRPRPKGRSRRRSALRIRTPFSWGCPPCQYRRRRARFLIGHEYAQAFEITNVIFLKLCMCKKKVSRRCRT
jgi:hypothetical protein